MQQTVSEITVQVPWGEMRGKVWGPDDGRPVLCLHGWADNCGTFNTLVPLLPKGCKYVAVDLPGHGLSSHRPPGVFYCFPGYVADVRRVVEALNWTRFSLIGHSMGGDVAGMVIEPIAVGHCVCHVPFSVSFSALYPEMVDALVLLDCHGFTPTDPKDTPHVMRRGMEQMMQFEKKKEEKKERVYTYEKALERLLAANPSLSEQSARILLERGLTQVEGGFVFSRDLQVNFKSQVRYSMEHSLEMQSRIRARILVILTTEGFEKIFPELDQTFITGLLRGLKELNGVVLKVPGGHHVHLNSPDTVAAFVSDFLQNELSPPAEYSQTVF